MVNRMKKECASMLHSLKIYKYEDLISEAEAISNGNVLIVTNNHSLKMTLISMMGWIVYRSKILLDLIVDAGIILYTQDPSKYIDVVAKHQYCKYKSCEYRKVYEIQNIILNIKNEIMDHAADCQNYDDFLDLHQKFVKAIAHDKYFTDIEDEYVAMHSKIVAELSTDSKASNIMTSESYLEKLLQYHRNKMLEINDQNVHENIISIDEYINNVDQYRDVKKWFGGLIHANEAEYSALKKHDDQNSVYSYSVFENQKYNDLNDYVLRGDCIIEDVQKKVQPVKCKYQSPSPTEEFRSKEFAINHITKLVNNPYHFYIECILNLKQINYHPNHAIGVLIHLLIEYCIKHYNVIHSVQDACNAMQSELSQYKHTKAQRALIESKLDGIADIVWNIIESASEIYAEKEGVQKIYYLDNEYTLYGRADLIYKDKNGKYGIFDFKTGYVPSWIELINGIAPQISLSILMLNYGAFTEDEVSLENMCDSGFISPNKIMKLENVGALIESSKYGIAGLIDHFWINANEYTYMPNGNILHKCIARSYENY